MFATIDTTGKLVYKGWEFMKSMEAAENCGNSAIVYMLTDKLTPEMKYDLEDGWTYLNNIEEKQ